MSEEWREVSGTDGRYQISNMGRLRKNYKRRPSRIFLGHKSSYGYVSMSVDGRKVFRHVLIARASTVSEHLGVAPMTIYRLLHRWELRGYRIGRSWRVDPVDLAAYLRGAASDGDE